MKTCWSYPVATYAFVLTSKTQERRTGVKKITFLFSFCSRFVTFHCGWYLCVYCLETHWGVEKAAICKASGMGVLFFLQMSHYKPISLPPFCLISLHANLFILDSGMKMLIAAAWSLFFCCTRAIALSLCFPSLHLQPSSHPRCLVSGAFSLMWSSSLTVGPGMCKCLISSRVATWPRQCCSSDCFSASVDLLFSSQLMHRLVLASCLPSQLWFSFLPPSTSEVGSWLLKG